ncbi:MAG: hypothetical protein O3B13_06685 [Planctomycetota bacterium]|nr:hypothetical protein [Planctomycetota bacterium]MDA1162769.1 hypothetical protein [Planctomycetota bacterium]
MQPTNESFIRQPRFLILTALVLLAALCRLFDGFQNIAPIGAIALFGGACFHSRKAAFMVPLSALLLSDVLLNLTRHSNQWFEAWQTTSFTYLAFALVVGLGLALRSHTRSAFAVMTGSVAASLIFFFVTNFGWWLTMGFHPLSFAGLAECYALALPFFRNTIASDLFFNSLLFGSFAFMEIRILAARPQVETV